MILMPLLVLRSLHPTCEPIERAFIEFRTIVQDQWASHFVVGSSAVFRHTQGRRPRGGDWGDGRSYQNLRWGTASASVPPIFWEVVLSDARESLNRVKTGVFLVRKGSYTTFYIVKIWKMCEKKAKIRKSEIFPVKMEFFSKENVIPEILAGEKIVRPPNSAPGLRH